jgi:hypothetical protein
MKTNQKKRKDVGLKMPLPPRKFNPERFLHDALSTVQGVAQSMSKMLQMRLGERISVAEANAVGADLAKDAFTKLMFNRGFMRHIADARTSQDRRKAKEGRTKPLVASEDRAAELKRAGMSRKEAFKVLEQEGLIKVLDGGDVKFDGRVEVRAGSSIDSWYSLLK